jgi:hypothetical protein
MSVRVICYVISLQVGVYWTLWTSRCRQDFQIMMTTFTKWNQTRTRRKNAVYFVSLEEIAPRAAGTCWRNPTVLTVRCPCVSGTPEIVLLYITHSFIQEFFSLSRISPSLFLSRCSRFNITSPNQDKNHCHWQSLGKISCDYSIERFLK